MDFHFGTMFMLSGQPLEINSRICVRHPKIHDIWTLGGGLFCEDIYWSYVMTLLSDPYDAMVWLDDHGIDYETVTSFDVFVMRWAETKVSAETQELHMASTMFSDALSFFLGEHTFDVMRHPSGETYIYAADDTSIVFGREVFDLISAFIMELHCIKRTDKIKPATKSAKRVLIEDKRDEEFRARTSKKKPEPSDVIGTALSALLFGGSISPLEVRDLPLFSVLRGSSVKTKQMRVQAMLNGVYTGMMKPDGIDPSEFNWADVAH